MNGYRRGNGRYPQRAAAPQANEKNIDRLADQAGAALGTSANEVKQAAQSGDLQKIMAKLTPQQSKQLRKILADEEAAKKLLATPQAQAIMKGLSKK